jgi:riboflavin kinase/FMN adenylyltransferase
MDQSGMKVLHGIPELSSLRGPVALAIGVFDGVHLGHQEVISEAIDYASHHNGTCVVMTFDPHPMAVLRPDRAPKRLCSTLHTTRILERLGAENLLLVPFTKETAQTSAAEFVGALVSACKPLGFISVGYEWAFGKGREGNIHRLMELGQEHGFAVCGVPSVKINGETVSSTLVREAVRNGDLARAKSLLGRDFSVMGEVVLGRQLGRQLGFPTANIALEPAIKLPPNGVYAVRVRIGNEAHPSVANLGLRPTVAEGAAVRTLEVHLLDFDADLYGQTLEVEFVSFIRGEQKFAGLDELKAQITRDSAAAGTIFEMRNL